MRWNVGDVTELPDVACRPTDGSGLAQLLPRAARSRDTHACGVMPMRKLRSSLVRPHGLVVMPRIYAGHIGPIRREIIFEPLPQTLPAEPVPAPPAPVPETQPEEPVPTPA